MKIKSIGSLVVALFTLAGCAEPQIVYVYQPMPNNQQGYYGQQQQAYYPQNGGQFAYPQQNQTVNQGTNLPAAKSPVTPVANNTQKNQQAALPANTKAVTTPAQNTTAPKTTTAQTKEEKVLAKAKASFEAIQTMQLTATTYEKGFTGKEGSGQIKVFYKNPGQFKIEILKSPDSSQVGVKLAYSQGSSVKVRPAGALSLVSLDLAMNDEKIVSGRSYQLNQMDLSSTVQRLTAPGVQAKLLGQTQVSGANVILVEVVAKNHFDAKITKEVLGLDTTTFLPRMHEMYQGEQKVYSVQIPTITTNTPLPADAFSV